MRGRGSRLALFAVVGCVIAAAVFAGVLRAADSPRYGGSKASYSAAQGPELTLSTGDSAASVWVASDEVALFLRPGSSLRMSAIAEVGRLMGAGAHLLPGSTASVAFIGLEGDSSKTLSSCALMVRRVASQIAGSHGVRSVSPVLYRGRREAGGRIALTGNVIVRFTATSSTVSRRELLRRCGLSSPARSTFSPDIVSVRASDALSSVTISQSLAQSSIVEWAEPDTWTSMAATSSDPLFSAQWHLKNSGQRGGIPGEDINLGSVWNVYQGSPSEVVAVVDESTQIDHPDLRQNVLSNLCWDYVDNDRDPSPPAGSDENHGTACSGLVAARGGNGIGVSGVAPKAGLAAYRLLGNTTALTMSAALTRDGNVVDVRSNSWGPSDGESLQDFGPEVKAALQTGATTGRGGKGCIYVFAAGNGGETADVNFNSIANSRYVMAVGASDANGQLLPYSTTGACVFVNAPSGPGGSGDNCLAQAVSKASHASSPTVDLPFLRQYRDGFLGRSPAGRTLSQEYYSFGPEMVALAVKSPVLMQYARRAIVTWSPLFKSLDSGNGESLVTATQVEALESFLSACSAQGGASLRAAIATELGKARLDDFVGRPVGELWSAYEEVCRGSADIPGIETTDRTGSDGYSDLDYYDSFNGTSASTPIVSGACALILQANPLLSWRDVRAIIAATATKNDPSSASWSTNAAGYHVSNAYGFGRINVDAAVTAAKQWTLLGPETMSQAEAMPYLPVPDNLASGATTTLAIADNMTIEDVEVYLTVEHDYWGELDVALVSPSGTVCQLARSGTRSDSNGYDNWCFTTNHPFGESSAGTWTLRVADMVPNDAGRVTAWGIKVYGHDSTVATPPTVSILKPTAGQRGSTVTIVGVGFGDKRGAGTVKFGDHAAKCISWSNNRVVCRVPASTRLGLQRVTVKNSLGRSLDKRFRVKR
jgi:subtilisin-like proprotein convertase family protein/subtilisin family serine protease